MMTFFHINGYQLLRNDRCGRRGGGVCAWIHDSFSPVPISPHFTKPKCIECLIFSLSSTHTLCVLVYIPPGLSSTEHQNIATYLCDELDSFLLRNPDQLLMICGDFNDFDSGMLVEDFDLINKVVLPTRANAILDKLWMNKELSRQYSDCASVGPPLGNSDHNSVILKPTLNKQTDARRVVAVRDYRATYIGEFLNSLSVLDFSCLTDAADVDDMCKRFYELFNNAQRAIPLNYVTMLSRDKPWMTPILKMLIDQQVKAYRDRNWSLFLHYKVKV